MSHGSGKRAVPVAREATAGYGDFYRLLKDGLKAKVPEEHSGHNIETLRVIDWATPANNEFFLASQMWVAGDMYRRRCDLPGLASGGGTVPCQPVVPTPESPSSASASGHSAGK